MNRRIHIESSSKNLVIFLQGMQKDQLKKKLISGGGRDGGKIHTMIRMAQLQRCEDASKNDWGWLVNDLRWFAGFLEKG